MRKIFSIRLRLQRSIAAFSHDCAGLAATEFAFIVPLMLVMFFGTIEVSSAVAVDRKVTLMARTLSDLTSQSTSVADTDLTNFFNAAIGIMTPYTSSTTNSTISELYVDSTGSARVQWSKGSSPRTTGTTVAIPTALQISGTYLIYSEVNYKYVPSIGYVLAKTGITLSDVAYTRPRQSTCVIYPTPSSGTTPSCPTS